MPTSPPTILIGPGIPGTSAEANWTTWNNSNAVTTTDVLPSTRPGGAKQMLHVCTTGTNNGLVQAGFPDAHHTRSSVWVFVVRGKVGMGTGNGGNTGIDVKSTTTGKWEELQAPNGNLPANEFIAYSVSPDGACYYDAAVMKVD